VLYAVSKGVERILAAVKPAVLTKLLSEVKEQKRAEAEAETPARSLMLLWQFLMAGPTAFHDEDRHAWVIAVALRALEAQAAQWCTQPSLAATWLTGDVTGYGLMGALEAMLTSERIELEPTLAPLGVKALRSLIRLLLVKPDLIPHMETAEEAEDDAVEAQKDEEMQGEEAEEEKKQRRKKRRSKEETAPEGDAKEAKDTKEAEDAKDTVEGKEAENAKDAEGGKEAEDAKEVPVEEDQIPEEEGLKQKGPLEEADDAEDAEVQEDEEPLEDARQMASSLFDTVGGSSSSTSRPVEEALPGTATEPFTGDVAESLQRSRLRWLVVRLSHKSRGFLSNPSKYFVRLVSIFRLFTALVEQLSVDALAELLGPLLSPAYRCSTGFTSSWHSKLPEVTSLEQAVALNTAQRGEFLGQLAQTCIDNLSQKMQDAGRSSEFTRALGAMRKAVEKGRSSRVQKRRLMPVTDPQAAAASKRAKNRRKVAGKKRKMEELIQTTKGGRGKQKVKQSRSLI